MFYEEIYCTTSFQNIISSAPFNNGVNSQRATAPLSECLGISAYLGYHKTLDVSAHYPPRMTAISVDFLKISGIRDVVVRIGSMLLQGFDVLGSSGRVTSIHTFSLLFKSESGGRASSRISVFGGIRWLDYTARGF